MAVLRRGAEGSVIGMQDAGVLFLRIPEGLTWGPGAFAGRQEPIAPSLGDRGGITCAAMSAPARVRAGNDTTPGCPGRRRGSAAARVRLRTSRLTASPGSFHPLTAPRLARGRLRTPNLTALPGGFHPLGPPHFARGQLRTSSLTALPGRFRLMGPPPRLARGRLVVLPFLHGVAMRHHLAIRPATPGIASFPGLSPGTACVLRGNDLPLFGPGRRLSAPCLPGRACPKGAAPRLVPWHARPFRGSRGLTDLGGSPRGVTPCLIAQRTPRGLGPSRARGHDDGETGEHRQRAEPQEFHLSLHRSISSTHWTERIVASRRGRCQGELRDRAAPRMSSRPTRPGPGLGPCPCNMVPDLRKIEKRRRSRTFRWPVGTDGTSPSYS